MTVLVNYWAVVVAAIASFAIGGLWYGPLFGKQWMALSGVTKSDMDEAKKKGMVKSYIIMFIGSLVMGYVLSHVYVFASTYANTFGASSGVMAGFWSWLGFIAPVTMGSVLWEGKSWRLWFLNNAYYIVTLAVMGAIIGGWN